MADEQVKLLGMWPSPFVQRVEWVLQLKVKGIQYEYVEEDLSNKSPLKVPVLVHNRKPIVESLIIMEYIDELWKQNSILPKDPYERAVARFWAKFAEEKVLCSNIHSEDRLLIFTAIIKLTEVIKKAMLLEGDEQDKEVKQAVEALEIVEGELKGKKFFGGDTIGYLDIVLGWIPILLGVVEGVSGFKAFEPHKNPALAKWMGNFVEVPVIKANLPARDKLVAYFLKLRSSVVDLAAKKMKLFASQK